MGVLPTTCCTICARCCTIASGSSTSRCRSKRPITPTTARAASWIRAASCLKQSHCPPYRNTRAQGQQRDHAVGGRHRPRLLVREQPTVGSVVQRQVRGALIRQEEPVA